MRARLVLPAAFLLCACGDPPASSPPVEPVPPAERLASPDVRTRIEAARSLRGGGAEAARALGALAAALSDRNRDVREAAAEALRDLGPLAAPALPGLRTAFSDEDVYVRWRVAEAMGRMGAAAVEVVRDLEARAADEDESEIVRAASARAAERIRGNERGGEPAR